MSRGGGGGGQFAALHRKTTPHGEREVAVVFSNSMKAPLDCASGLEQIVQPEVWHTVEMSSWIAERRG